MSYFLFILRVFNAMQALFLWEGVLRGVCDSSKHTGTEKQHIRRNSRLGK